MDEDAVADDDEDESETRDENFGDKVETNACEDNVTETVEEEDVRCGGEEVRVSERRGEEARFRVEGCCCWGAVGVGRGPRMMTDICFDALVKGSISNTS